MFTHKTILRSILVLIFTCNFFQISAQKETKEIQFNIHKNEIGIDIQNIFSGTLGTSIIYKRRIGEKKFISLNSKKAIRIRVGGQGEIPVGDKLDVLSDSLSPINFTDLLTNGFQLHSLIGLEWQKQKNRVQYFYGLETGLRYANRTYVTGWSYNSNTGYTFRFSDQVERTIPLIGFGGIKFFITPEFSLSLETSLEVNYNFKTIGRSLVNQYNGTEYERKGIKTKEINYHFDYLAFLNFSYYF